MRIAERVGHADEVVHGQIEFVLEHRVGRSGSRALQSGVRIEEELLVSGVGQTGIDDNAWTDVLLGRAVRCIHLEMNTRIGRNSTKMRN